MLGRDAAWQLINELPRAARGGRAHVLDDQAYPDIARATDTSEAVVRKRVSRGLGALRQRMAAMSDFVTALREELVDAAERERGPPAAARAPPEAAPGAPPRGGGRDGADRRCSPPAR